MRPGEVPGRDRDHPHLPSAGRPGGAGEERRVQESGEALMPNPWRESRVEQSNWRSLRRAVLRRDDHRCRLRYVGCTVDATEVDHKVPAYLTGNVTVTEEDLQSACSHCHGIKSRRESSAAAKAKAARRRLPKETHPSRVV